MLPVLVFVMVAAACVWLWSRAGLSGGVPGIAEGVRSVVSSPRIAAVQQILVKPYQNVEAGDPVAVVMPIDPRAELSLLQTELNLTRMSLQPSIAEENAMNFEQIRVDLLRTKSELAIAKVNLERLENQVRRNTPLFADKLIAEDIYDLDLKTRDVFKVEVIEKSNAVAQIEARLNELEKFGQPEDLSTNSPVALALARLNLLRARVATNWAPITLRAPISGMVSAVAHQPGENALEGEPIVAINALVSDRVVCYLRQPYTIDLHVGMEVVMTTRERKARQIPGSVAYVGAQLELITNALAYIKPGALVDVGLPVAIQFPPDVELRPGEILDLTFKQRVASVLPSILSPTASLQHTENERN